MVRLAAIVQFGDVLVVNQGASDLKSFMIVFSLTLSCGASFAGAQEKVAEGQYQMRSVTAAGTPATKTLTRWSLFAAQSGGYHLRSEIEQQAASIRVAQIEELDNHFVPTAIGYELYRGEQKFPEIPNITARCTISNSVVCTGVAGNERAVPSAPYTPKGPFWMWMEGLFSLDMPWLFDGAVNMAHPGTGKAKINTLVVSGGTGVMIGDAVNVAVLERVKKPGQTLTVVAPDKPIPWSFRSAEESSFEFVASEQVEVNSTKVAVKHYSSSQRNTSGGLWITDSGLIIRMALGEGSSFILVGFKQYRKIIPELPVEQNASSIDTSRQPISH
jgi:hypothetical protein